MNPHVERFMQYLAEEYKNEYADQSYPSDEPDYCPKCGSDDVAVFDDGYTVCSSCDGLDND